MIGDTEDDGMFLRALLAFLALPVVVGGLVPWLLLGGDGWRMPGTIIGWPVLLSGMGVVLRCARDFYEMGKGTLAPWAPPRNLVVVGFYRFVRNPMYLGVLGWVAGWSLVAGSPMLAAYACILAILFHLRVVFYEEPVLGRKFGDRWTEYCSTVNRWIPKLKPKPAAHSSRT
jgi:protein-S-isoprenylcysteine O-methyltransferase Ste14